MVGNMLRLHPGINIDGKATVFVTGKRDLAF